MITALVCTRNRGNSISRTIETILANTHPEFEMVIVDQSTNEETAAAVAPFLTDPRLRYVRTPTKGLGKARNVGILEARAPVIAFTDDDCEVPTDWLTEIERAFVEHPGVAVVFCNVKAAEYDTQAGFIPAYCRTDSKLLTTFRDKCKARGIGAGIAVRREAALKLGGFDEMLGAGAPFPSCEDGDMAVRALLKGYQVYETNATAVIHYGFRTWKEGQALSARDWVGIGAAYAKPLRRGRWSFLVVPAYELVCVALWAPLNDLLHLRKPRGLRRITGFFSGFFQGWRQPIDPETLCFQGLSRTSNVPSIRPDTPAL